ncbi:MAG: AAA family ATPase, partial [Bacilli bacterium]
MKILSLELKNFRNYKNAFVEFGDGLNVLYGKNASGKTN